MKCPKCKFDNPEGAKFCIEGGHKFIEQLAIEGERKTDCSPFFRPFRIYYYVGEARLIYQLST